MGEGMIRATEKVACPLFFHPELTHKVEGVQEIQSAVEVKIVTDVVGIS